MQNATAKNSPIATPNATMPTPMPRLPCTARLNSSDSSADGGCPAAAANAASASPRSPS